MQTLTQFILENAQLSKIASTKSNSQRRKLLKQYLKGKYDDYLEKLESICKDPKAKSLLDDAFGGPIGDVALKFSEEAIPVKRLMPTQKDIGIESSLKHLLSNPSNVEKEFESNVEIVHPLITFNRAYVIDGHHRWSEIFCANPNAKVVCLNYDGDISVMQMLKATQGAIAAAVDCIPQSHTKGKNLYDCSDDELYGYIEEMLSDETCEAFKKVAGLDSEEDVISWIFSNCKELIDNYPPVPSAPTRDKMPQTSKGNGMKKDGALAKMKNGNVLKI